MKRFLFVLLAAAGITGLNAEVVNNSLGKALAGIFPSLAQGYIDLNHNGKIDRLDDMDELVPDSRIKDGIIQVQEIMDFISENYPFFLLEELEAVQKALVNPSGTIPELIGLNYTREIQDLIRKKEALGIDGLYLSPSSRKEAMAKMSALVGTMVGAYKKERTQDESALNTARDELFTMIEQGYPIIEGLPREEKNVLVSVLIQTALTERAGNPARVKYAVKTLGKLKDPFAVPYIIEVMKDKQFAPECIRALGEIGNSDAEKTLMGMLDTASDEAARIALYKALGRIGGRESSARLVSLLEKAEKPSPNEEWAVLQALSGLAQAGNTDRKISAILTGYLGSAEGGMRVLAARGLAANPSPANLALLMSALKNERDESAKIEFVQALNINGNAAIINVYITMLREPAASPEMQKTLMREMGKNSEGGRGVAVIQPYLGSPAQDLRSTAKTAFLSLYKFNAKLISSTLARIVTVPGENLLQIEASSLLAEIADPDTVSALGGLLKSPLPEVKQNATWALYKIGVTGNPRIVEDLKRLISSETEPIEVRINAVRTLGNSGQVSDDIIQTLLTAIKMRGEKYSMLRYFSIIALGKMDVKNPDAVNVLSSVASREKNLLLKKAALDAVKRIGKNTEDTRKNLETMFKRSDDAELRTLVIETLGDLRLPAAAELAETLDFKGLRPDQKQRVVYSLSMCATEKAFNLIITNSGDPDVSEIAGSLLEDTSPRLLRPVVEKRLRTETNETVIGLLEELQAGFASAF